MEEVQVHTQHFGGFASPNYQPPKSASEGGAGFAFVLPGVFEIIVPDDVDDDADDDDDDDDKFEGPKSELDEEVDDS